MIYNLLRYTDIPALISILTERKITLLDPMSWDDRNDSFYLSYYREKKKLESVLALCFTQADETYHHWRVFANGPAGVCIRFRPEELLDAVKKRRGIQTAEVTYRQLWRARRMKFKTEELPFIKRWPFADEKEFRIIYTSRNNNVPALDIPIPLSCVKRVTLSPWMHPALADNVKRTLRSIEGCGDVGIYQSTLINNEEWKNLGEGAAGRKRARSLRELNAGGADRVLRK